MSTSLNKDQIIKISDRNFIGCDQLIIVNYSKEYDAELIFYNSDGSITEACGNGTRCVAYILSLEKEKNKISLKTASGVLNSKIISERKFSLLLYFDKTRKEFRNEILLISFIINIAFMRPELCLENIEEMLISINLLNSFSRLCASSIIKTFLFFFLH